MKGITIILVVIGHYAPEGAPHWYLSVVKGIYSFHMPLFMFLSGLLFCATMRPGEAYVGFMKRKSLRLMVPYLFVSVVIIATKILTGKVMPSEHPVDSAAALVEMFYYPSAAYYLWFLWALWLIFFIAATLRTVRSRNIFLAATIVLDLLPITWPETFCLRQAVGIAPFFAIGMSVWDYRRYLDPLRRAIDRMPWAAIALFGILYAWSLAVDNYILRGALQFAVALAGIMAVGAVSVVLARVRKSRVIIAVGTASFAIYLFHTTFEGFAKGLLGRSPLALSPTASDVTFILGAVIVITSGVAVPWLLHRHLFSRSRLLSLLTATPLTTKRHPDHA